MRLGGMWRDAITGITRHPVTEKYPFERLAAPDNLRSKLHWNLDECTGCGLCAKDCPADAIDVIVLDRKAKRFVFRYFVDRCTFCGQCSVSCRKSCIEMQNDEWELAALGKDEFTIYYGAEADVQSVLANAGSSGDSEPTEG